MLPDTTIKRLNTLGDIAKCGKKVNGLMRLMESTELWMQAYSNIASNKGVITKGVDNVTLDGFSVVRVKELIELIKNNEYNFTPVRRTYIPKKNGKKRPLGVPNGNDKLVQEVCRIILEQIYEKNFSNYSHGFRPQKSCHTALKQVHDTWTGAKWMIVMDIQGFFDNINHDVMLNILRKRIDDERFIKLIEAMLKAGYLEDWKFNQTYSGMPQGGVISPILANIYLHELDMYVEELIKSFNKGVERKRNPEYLQVTTRIKVLRDKEKRALKRLEEIDSLMKQYEEEQQAREMERATNGSKTKVWRQHVNKMKSISNQIERIQKEGSDSAIAEIRAEINILDEKKRTLPYGDPFDANYKRVRYCRYADDFILGVIGSKKEATMIACAVEDFIQNVLKLEIADDKFNIVRADEGVDFLGYIVHSYDKPVPKGCVISGRKTVMRSTGRIQLVIPNAKINEFCIKHGYGDYYQHKPASRGYLTCHSDAEVIETYNAELRGFVNYYSLGMSYRKKLGDFVSLARTSCAMTLAHKHRTTTCSMIKTLKNANGEWIRKVPTSTGYKEFRIYRLKTDDREHQQKAYNVDLIPNVYQFTMSRTELVQRLEANCCEICGSQQDVEVHHIRKLADVKDSTSLYDRMMIARNRKTLVLCSKCHHMLHKGNLPSK